MKRMLAMQASVCLFAVMAADCSFAVDVPALHPSEHVDTEVSTNFSFAVGESGGCRLVFSLELQASPTNNVEVAIGHDADCDGHLSLDETALAVGYDCGEWFVRSAANDSVTYSDAAESGLFAAHMRFARIMSIYHGILSRLRDGDWAWQTKVWALNFDSSALG